MRPGLRRASLALVASLLACHPREAPLTAAPDAAEAPAVPACDPLPLCPAEPAEGSVALTEVSQWRRVEEILAGPPERVDIGEVSALLSQASDPSVDVSAVLANLDAMAQEVRASLPPRCDARCRARNLSRWMFRVWRFEAEEDPNGLYNDPDRDLIDRVIESRVGYCEGLSVLYMALAHRLDVPVVGVLSRQHIHVRYVGPGGSFDIDTTREGGPPLPSPDPPGCRAREGVYGAGLDARGMVGQVVSVVGILEGLPARRAWLDAAVRLAPMDPDLRNNRGVDRERTLDLAGALEDYRAASELDPCVGFYRTNVAGALRRLGRVDEAAAVLDGLGRAAQSHAVEEDGLYLPLARGDLALERGDDAEASRWYGAAVQGSREAPIAHESLGIARLVQGDYRGAAEEFLGALERDPRADTRMWLVEALTEAGDDNATTELDRAERDGASEDDVLLWRAQLAARAGRWAEARSTASRCLAMAGSRCARGLVVLGEAARAQGDAVCARRYWEGFLGCRGVPRDRYRRALETRVRASLGGLTSGASDAGR